MRFGTLHLKNFMSYRRAAINFSNRGMYLITGRVRGSASFSSNGAGKSALGVEALTWVLTGRTIRGTDADGMVNVHTNKNCTAVLPFKIGSALYRIRRYRKHTKEGNALYFELRKGKKWEDISSHTITDTQKKINSIIGIDYDAFKNTVVFGQDVVQRFSVASDTEKGRIFEELLQLKWLSASYKKVRDKRTALNKKLLRSGQLKDKHRAIVSHLESLSSHMSVQHQTTLHNYVQDMVENLDQACTMNSEMYGAEEQIEPFHPHDDLRRLKESRDSIRAELKGLRDKLRDVQDNMHPANNIMQADEEMKDVMQKETDCMAVLRKIKSKEYRCPTCKQELMRRTHRQKVWRSVSGELKSARTRMTHIEKSIIAAWKVRDLNSAISAASSRLQSVQDDIESVHDNITNYRDSVRRYMDSYRKYLYHLHRAAKIKDVLVKEVRTYKKSDLSVKLKRHRRTLRKYNRIVQKITARLSVYDYWYSAFSSGGIKSFVMQKSIPFLNKAVQRYSNVLTDGQIHIRFNSTSPLKSGEVRNKLSVSVSKHGGGKTYEGISGGQRKRADICQAFALRELVMHRGSKSIQLLILDEVFDGLDEVGLVRMADLLQLLAEDGSTIVVISNDKRIEEYFDNIVRVESDNDTSRVV